jgi:phosphate starvation-inducible PhoH-like protein
MRKEVKLTRGIETLFGTLDENLRLLESSLRLKAHLKNDSLELEGEAHDIERMEQIVTEYGQLTKEGLSFNNGDLRAYLKVIIEDPSASLRALVANGRQRQFGRKSVVPKSHTWYSGLDRLERVRPILLWRWASLICSADA